MRRAKLRYGDGSLEKNTSPYKARVMSNLGKLVRPKCGLTMTFLLCIFSTATLFLIGTYYRGSFWKEEAFKNVEFDVKEVKQTEEFQDVLSDSNRMPSIKSGRFQDRIPQKLSQENDEAKSFEKTSEVEKDKQNIVVAKRKTENGEQKVNTATENAEYFVLLQLVNAHSGSKFADNFYNCIKSIMKRTKLDLKFLLTVDDVSKATAEKVFQEVAHDLNLKKEKMPNRTYFPIEQVNEKVFPYTKALQQLFSSGEGAYYSHAIFFIAPVIHKILPKNIKRVVMLDTDLQFRADIKDLFRLFDSMSERAIMALATDQQPVYRHVLWSYRNKNPGTKVGGPPPDGLTGFNSGVKLVNVEEMRNSKLYNQLIQGQNASRLAKKYDFKGHLGDQDFYSLISFDYPHLFYNLPCQWNRQLCTWWKNHGYQHVFDMYFKCDAPYYVLHGNCNTPIPSE
ncbi:xyloside xylosyltransferase 1-like [Rhopilema esculentum]|uniref:xyloside xylosyltransferase 1-like n=1 Tax=Rhopilema esculentum TaxID=499914 RepID=UPI0031D93C0C|eukprot:gene6641-12182_t